VTNHPYPRATRDALFFLLGIILVYALATTHRFLGRPKKLGLSEHLTKHLTTMAELNRASRYDRMADGVERVTGRPAMSVREFVSLHANEFGGRRS
jgi:hypothetical protein